MTADTSIAGRATTRFYLLHLAAPKLRIDTLPYFLTSREWYNGGYNRSGIPFYSKFGFEMGETWAVSHGQLLALSFSAFGICKIDPSARMVISAMNIRAGRRRTTDAERLAVHEMFPGIDGQNPDGTNWGQELDDHWPSTTPWYMHMVAGDRLIAASRSISIKEDAVDLFDGDSYLGTVTTAHGWLHQIVAVAGDSLLWAEPDTTMGAQSLTWFRMRPAR
jgi:hypothetical protein